MTGYISPAKAAIAVLIGIDWIVALPINSSDLRLRGRGERQV
ncbi:hypothetical protein [Ruegeria atlantica]|nr:hypothetical protein [Ruegeria atlantica]